jgi:MerR family transcriptional regulator, light-induced transcriptional regulator
MTAAGYRPEQAIRSRIASLGAAIATVESGAAPAEDRVIRLLDALARALEGRDVQVVVDDLRTGQDGDRLIRMSRRVLVAQLAPSVAMQATAYLDAAAEQLATEQRTEALESPAGPPETDTLCDSYLQSLIEGQRREASEMILSAVDAGLGVREVYRGVFQPTLYEVGRLWQRNLVTVAQEHYITAATQLIMSQLYPRIFSTKRRDRRLVATCVSGELHEVGVRMVADFFEMDGWDTYYLGANAPPEEVVREAKMRRAQVLAVSATLTDHIPRAQEVIAALKRNEGGERIKAVVGGQAFAQQPEAWKQIGADGYDTGADGAVKTANRWLDDA